MNRKTLYWLCNFGGWFLYVLLYALLNIKRGLSYENAWLWFIIFFFGLFFSHLYRLLIVRFDWLRLSMNQVIPRLALTCVVLSSFLGLVTIGAQIILLSAYRGGLVAFTVYQEVYLSTILGYLLIFVLWTLCYFAVHYFLNHKKVEIENLRWQASMTEIELNKLKSQLNPHFVFNCMNSIRALIDENPAKAKEAVTQLSNILRNTLMMGRNKLVPFMDEMKIVRDYLGLEAIRLEERLQIEIDVAPECSGYEVPPLMIQTLVENGIKHGVSTLTQGGKLQLRAWVNTEVIYIEIRNSGQYKGNTDSETGFGIANTIQRLSLLFTDKAQFGIRNETNEMVLTQLIIPKL
jgi:two-component system LytT family sensor kinase